MITIEVINESTVLTDLQVTEAAAAIEHQVHNHLVQGWSIPDVKIVSLTKGTRPSNDTWWLVVLDNSDVQGALGYHELTATGLPMGKIFAQTCAADGVSWTVDLSHEILEIIVDRFCSFTAQNDNGDFYALEVCDAVEADQSGYYIGSTLVSDFLYPDWFNPVGKGKMSFKDRISAPFTLASGGYASVCRGGNWTQLWGDVVHPVKVGGRRDIRLRPRSEWRNSTVPTRA